MPIMNYRKGLYRDLPNLKRHTQILIFHICPKGFRETIYGLAKTLKRTHIWLIGFVQIGGSETCEKRQKSVSYCPSESSLRSIHRCNITFLVITPVALVDKVNKRLYPDIENSHIPETMILGVISRYTASQKSFPGIRRN